MPLRLKKDLTIQLHIFPGKDGKINFYEDDGISDDYLHGIFGITEIEMIPGENKAFKLVIHPVEGSFKGMPEVRQWQLVIHSNNSYRELTKEDIIIELVRDGKLITSGVCSGKIDEKLLLEIK